MKSNIVKRQEEGFKKAISQIFIKYIDNKKLKNIMISRVELDSISHTAKVYFSNLDDDEKSSMRNLENSRVFIQNKLASTQQFRSIPKLRFIYDKGYNHSSKIDQLLSDL